MPKTVTKAELARVLQLCIKEPRWGNRLRCPLCVTFLGATYEEQTRKKTQGCFTCCRAVGLWASDYQGCIDWLPVGSKFIAQYYFSAMSDKWFKDRFPVGFDPVEWRQQANATLETRIQELLDTCQELEIGTLVHRMKWDCFDRIGCCFVTDMTHEVWLSLPSEGVVTAKRFQGGNMQYQLAGSDQWIGDKWFEETILQQRVHE